MKDQFLGFLIKMNLNTTINKNKQCKYANMIILAIRWPQTNLKLCGYPLRSPGTTKAGYFGVMRESKQFKIILPKGH